MNSVLFFALLILFGSLISDTSAESRTSNSWRQMEDELEGELNSGLNEQQLTQMEMQQVNVKGTQCKLAQPRQCNTEGSVTVHMDISVDVGTVNSRPQVGTLTIELFNSTVPRTVANFITICDGRKPTFSYRGNKFHRIITGFMAQGGDITRGDGRGGKSIYGTQFADENFRCKHVCRGSLSMANAGPDTNGSQFFINFAATPWLNGKHVVFGQVTDGWPVLSVMEQQVVKVVLQMLS